MRKFSNKLNLLSFLLLIPTSLMGQEIRERESEREVLESTSTNIEIKEIIQTEDSSRIYLDEGAIWASRDITRFDPVFDLSLSDKLEVSDGKLVDSSNFTVSTNFSYYIEKYQLEIYQGGDSHLSQPIAVIKGEKLANDDSIEWDGLTDVDYKFIPGRQLLFRLKAWDKAGNMDTTTVGVTDLVKADEDDIDLEIEQNDNQGDNENEKARSYGLARLMRHNIPTNAGMAKFIGTGLKGVDRVIIGDDDFVVEDGELYGEQYLPTDAYLFPTKVIFDDGSERDFQLYVRIPDTYYAQTGLADLYLGKNNISGSDDALSVDDQYQGDIYNQGRLAYFGQGKFGDKWRVTAHFDTKENELKDMFKEPFASDETDVFDIIEEDDELYYGNYGDSANIEQVVNTKGKMYLNVEYDKSSYLWGNYNTGLTGSENSDYNRSLYGFKGDYRSRETTQYGEDRLNIVGFVSEADTLYAHDEFLGTGGSLYFLSHNEAVPGSDKVMVKVIDETSGITQSEVILQPGRDYEFDAFQGRIILTQPLDNIMADNFGTVIDNNDGYENYLAVDYEYVPEGSEALDAMTYGGRAKGWVNDYVGLGVNYVNQEKDSQDYTMYSGDMTLRATEGTYLKAEFAHSEGSQTESNYISYDGGLTFSSVNSDLDDRQGDMIQVTGVASLYDLAPDLFGAVGNDVSAWYRNKEAGYSFADQDDDLEQEAYGTQLRFQLTDRLALLGQYSALEEINTDGELETDTETIEVETQYMITDHVKIAFAGQQVEELNLDDEHSEGLLGGVRLDYMWDADSSVFISGQGTIDQDDAYEDNNSVSTGFEYQVTDDLQLGAEYTTGERGEITEATANYDVSDEHSTYLTYADDNYEGENSIIVGQRADLTSSLDFYQENQFVDDYDGHGQLNSYGFGYDFTDDIDAGISYQEGEIEDDNNQVTERQAISFSAGIDLYAVNFSHKFEYIVDKTDEATTLAEQEIHQIVTVNNYTHRLTEEFTLFGEYNYSKSESDTTHDVLERFVEATGGLAYRPIYNDRLNFLTRYTYLQNFEDFGDNSTRDFQDEESQIIELEGIYSIDAHWDIGLKYAHKDKLEAFERESGNNVMVASDIDLYGISGSYRVMKEWDVTAEYHWKVDSEYDDLEQGTLISVNKHMTENFKIGLGYNFSSFDNDLTNDDDYDASGFFVNLVGKI